MRIAFFLLVLANLLLFVWGQGYLGGREEGREPQRIADQLHPEKLKLALAKDEKLAVAIPAAPAAAVCRQIDALPLREAEKLRALIDESGRGMVATLRPIEEAPSFWVLISGLSGKPTAERKAAEIKGLGIAEYQLMADGNDTFALVFGRYRGEAAATDLLQKLTRKGVKSARVERREKPADRAALEIRGPGDILAKRLPEWLAGVAGASSVECP